MQFGHLKRREFITLLGCALATWPMAARGQTPDRIRRIGVLSAFAEDDPEARGNIAVFRQALEKLGWTDGGNVWIDYRWGGADDARILRYARELLALKPDVFLVSTALVLQPLQQLTRDIPIIFTQISDPVGSGFIASLAHPGGNITGFTPAEFSMYGKALEVLKEAAPHVTRVAVMLNPEQKPQSGMWQAVEAAAPSFRVQLTKAEVRNAAEIERAIDRFAREPNCGLVVLPNPVTGGNRKLIIAMAARHGLPAVYAFPFFAKEGGLISYGRGNHVHTAANQIGCQRRQLIVVVLRPAELDRHVLAFDEGGPVQTATELGHEMRGPLGRLTVEEPDYRHRRLLRARRERPRCRTAKKGDESAALHSMTSSAIASIPGGMVTPSAFAVLRLITNLSLVGCMTGRSAGLAPLRTLAVYTPAWRYASVRLYP